MRFCTNCGKELNDDAAFCTGCGTSTDSAPGTNAVNPANSGNTIVTDQPGTGGSYYQPSTSGSQSSGYYQGGAQNTPVTGYSQPNAPGTPTGYYQPSAPNGPYNSGGPNYPGGGPGKNNKTLVIVVSVIIGLCLIGGGIFAYTKLANKDNDTSLSDSNTEDDESDSSDNASDDADISDVIESDDATAEPDPEDSNWGFDSSSEGFSMFDAVTLENIAAACEETGIDIDKIMGLEEYGTWYDGTVYTFTYEDSVIDLLLYDDGTVFSIETGGVQVYITGYSSYSIDEYIGYTTHFDESYPDNGYVFFQDGQDMNSMVTFESSYDYDYVVELVEENTGDLAIAFYVQAGSNMSIDVPTGEYIIQYAAGAEWAGVDYLFGDDTLLYRSDSIYSFYPENESTITLDINGGSGIASTEITIDEF